jgi:hypothetical protein
LAGRPEKSLMEDGRPRPSQWYIESRHEQI